MKRSRPTTWAKWRRIVEEQAGSGKTAAAYCREHQVGMASFYAWKRQLGLAGAGGGDGEAAAGI